MNLRLLRSFLVLLAAVASISSALANGVRPPDAMNAAEMQLALRKLGVVGNVLYVAAHPDDENTAALAWLANGRLVRAGYLSITRGDGGQNLIGDEKGDLLGLIRTEELMAARNVDKAEQFFTRAVDFGYTKSAEETLTLWDKEKILSDVVWVVRSFRPDVILTRFPTNGDGGHGQHTASALLAVEAFEAAADPNRFPEQLKFVAPWKAKRILWNAWRWRQTDPAPTDALEMDFGGYSQLLGKSYGEIAGASRSMHRSQGFGAPERRGALVNYFRPLAGDPVTSDFLEGIDLSWNRVAGGSAIGPLVEKAATAFDPEHPERSLPALLEIRKRIAALDDPHAATKLEEVDEIIRSAAGLWLEAVSNVAEASIGDPLVVKAGALVRSPAGVVVKEVFLSDASGTKVPAASKNVPAGAPLQLNVFEQRDLELTVPSAAISNPHWLRDATTDERPRTMAYVEEQQLRTRATSPSALTAVFDLEIDGSPVRFTRPVSYRWVDRVRGELYRPFVVAPEITVTAPQTTVFPTAGKRQVEIVVERHSSKAWSGRITPMSAEGWTFEPRELRVELSGENRRQRISFSATPPAGMRSDVLLFTAAQDDRASLLPLRTAVEIDYEHIPPQQIFPLTSPRLVRADVVRRGSRVGYVSGAGDEVAEGLAQIGYEVVQLSDDDIASDKLTGLDAIVLGVRALNTRDALKQEFDHLLRYVERGGTLVVQYNTADETLAKNFAPFPLQLSRDRVTVEGAPVSFTEAAHPILTTPNKITAADFEGWVQERGLYFPGTLDEKYATMLSMNDPGEKPLTSGIVAARHGKGMYVYTPLSLFRQIPAGVPGAYRLLANLVANRAN